ncbi:MULTISPECIES: DUF805 domain-containing protein [unclassified Aureimonas]|uniref:DUF805 domain-containing protein n=1 Tax=unclassified Aureimonas TaxID=2615206 RepID=UPI000700EBC0|nr:MULTISPECIES: DUF805 domain-containing protein [unclassified Aureimonas]KQT52401.1 hypothetical protein ASG62_14320 [Aureimonas sp. Leaf427]KQT74918.1 hypothetical protein ASG54_16160 [Aureimonas sp. Leaf460]
MLTHYTNAMRKYAVFHGRASRAEFWSFYAVYLTASIAVILLDQAYFGTVRENSGVVVMLFGCVHILPGMAVQVRRLHDIDWSGWWIVLNLIGVGFILALFRGTDGPNRFGPEPGSIDDETFEQVHRKPHARGPRAEPSFDRNAVSPALPHSAPSASVRGPADLIGDLERLAALRASGGLTDAEFEVMKAQALSRGSDR